jgi:hypothetical protein
MGEGGVISAHHTAHTQLAGKADSEHAGKAYAKGCAQSRGCALAFARKLRALGDKATGAARFAAAAALHPSHRGILSEMGRLALDLEQVELAQKLPAEADDGRERGLADYFGGAARCLPNRAGIREAIPLYRSGALALGPQGHLPS